MLYNYPTYVHAIHHCQNLNFSKLFCLEDGKKCQIPAKSSATRNLRYLTLFVSFYALQNVGDVHSAS